MSFHNSYFMDGMAHALAAVALSALWAKISRKKDFHRPAFAAGALVSSCAIFFIPLHIVPRPSIADTLYQFLHYPLPDWDILLLGLPWHRFFLTHSLLIPLVLYTLSKGRPRAGSWLLGLFIGTASHLLWDAVSCHAFTPIVFIKEAILIRGFAAKMWLAANGLSLFYLACRLVQNKGGEE